MQMKVGNVLASTSTETQGFRPGHISPEVFQHYHMLFRKAFVDLYQAVCGILNIWADDYYNKVQHSHFGHVSLHIDVFYKVPNLRDLDIKRSKVFDGVEITVIIFL